MTTNWSFRCLAKAKLRYVPVSNTPNVTDDSLDLKRDVVSEVQKYYVFFISRYPDLSW